MHPCLLYSYAPPKRYGAYSTRGSSLSSSEYAFGDSLVVSDVQSGCSIIGEGEVHTGLYIGLDGLYGGESGGASGTESSRRFRACCLTSSGTAAIISSARFASRHNGILRGRWNFYPVKSNLH